MKVLFEAILELHTSNKLIADLLTNDRIADAIERNIVHLVNRSRGAIAEARAEPVTSKVRAVTDLIASGLTELRAVCCNTSHTGQLYSEADKLNRRVLDMPIAQGETAFLMEVNTLFVRHKQLLGHDAIHQLETNGTLTPFLPNFLSRLSSDRQARALTSCPVSRHSKGSQT